MIHYHNLNLSFREDRKYALLGNYATLNIPREDVHIHTAPYGMDYESVEALCEDAAKDGFPGFLRVSEAPEDNYCHRMGRNSFAYVWGTLKIIREIANSDTPYGYYNQDDCFLTMKYGRYPFGHTSLLENHVQWLSQETGDFMFLQLRWYDGGNPVEKTPVADFDYYNHGVYHTGDSGLVFSNAGAQVFVDYFQERFRWMEGVPLSIGRQLEMVGVYSADDPLDTTFKVPVEFLAHATQERALDDLKEV